MTNAIEYADINESAFAIKIDGSETKNDFIIKFKDWGIGIRKGLEEKIFEERFRDSEAVSKDVTGSGLGLTMPEGL